jgi:hypothetical protein
VLVSPVEDNRRVFLQFDYLDRGQGAVVQVVHSGAGGSKVKLRGTIKGAERPKVQGLTVPVVIRLGLRLFLLGPGMKGTPRRRLLLAALGVGLEIVLVAVGLIYTGIYLGILKERPDISDELVTGGASTLFSAGLSFLFAIVVLVTWRALVRRNRISDLEDVLFEGLF